MKLIPILPLAALLFSACASSGAGWHNADALDATSVEMAVDREGRPLEVEYHIDPSGVPAVVHEAMNALHPGGRAVAAEKEYVDGELFWELSKVIGGKEVEAMFHPDGRLHSEEVEVAAASVPEAVRAAVRSRIGADATKWEEIRGADRSLFEYHAKALVDGKNYKVMVGLDAVVTSVVREVAAEIEVPVR